MLLFFAFLSIADLSQKYGVQVDVPLRYPLYPVDLDLDLNLESELLLGQKCTPKAAVALIAILLTTLVICDTTVLAIRLYHGTPGLLRTCAAAVKRTVARKFGNLSASNLDTAQTTQTATSNDGDNNYATPAVNTRVCGAPAGTAKRRPASSATRHGKVISIGKLLPKPGIGAGFGTDQEAAEDSDWCCPY
ncbi:hypothetical protein H4R99_006485 [Coemansia sp. RSA 1722]|nr:hypothetical protein LPJ57_003498 [Coemansia sp. RSA 486]KAJ2592201.1 hypothetical protein H4R99_006485 [Coemansia sp. RSA 1722]